MIFSSVSYLAFLCAVFVVYWRLPRRAQNLFLLVASYFFYACWDVRFLPLLFFSTAVDWTCGGRIFASDDSRTRRYWLWASIVCNLGMLGYFKYYNFFAESLVSLFASLGMEVSHTTANIVLPVGISFFTFQSLSYSIDIYRRKLEPVQSFLDYAAFVAFFPQLVAGPIVRANEFLFQLGGKRAFSWRQVESGLVTFLFGFLKKAFVADWVGAKLVNPVFDAPQSYSSGSLWLAVVAYSVQLYADFSGYSSMAIGSARLLGFEIPENFAFPYLSRSVPEYWKRWHITMSRFFRDYVYIPLGGSKWGRLITLRNIVITTFLSGLWHGASWNFIIWGLLHGLFISVYSIWYVSGIRARLGVETVAGALCAWGLTQLCILFTRVFFRAPDLDSAWMYLCGLYASAGTNTLELNGLLLFAFFLEVLDHLYGYVRERGIDLRVIASPRAQAIVYAALLLFIFHVYTDNAVPFIYFAF